MSSIEAKSVRIADEVAVSGDSLESYVIGIAPLIEILGPANSDKIAEAIGIKRIILRHAKKRFLIFLGNLSIEAIDLNVK